MKILQVIHGYPPRYNAGSEVYTQTLCHGLAARHDVHVFTRQEDPYVLDYAVGNESDRDNPRVQLHTINLPRSRDRYRHEEVDKQFAQLLDVLCPEVVHIGHLNHLSTTLTFEAARREIPILYTLHDYWLMCPRGQFMQFHPEDPTNIWAACDGQEHRKCAERCYARIFSGSRDEWEADAAYWENWVARRMTHVKEIVECVDRFIAPSRYLLERFRDDFGIPEAKLTYLDYGFDLTRLEGRRRNPGEPFTFGYIGRHVPAKGIHHLIEAFGNVSGDANLRIWGRPDGQSTDALRASAECLGEVKRERVEWLHEYRNQNIVEDVFNQVDAIVVPSVWVENSPLVIHEALQAGVPVITADAGGMREYVHDGVNGLLYSHRNPGALATQMQRLMDDPAYAAKLGSRGYLESEAGEIPDIQHHVREVERLYEKSIHRRNNSRVTHAPVPWRITFDTNPDDCNLRCIMCEEHSIYSPRQPERRANGQPKRRMPMDLIRRVVGECAGRGLREIIPSTMGEPLLYPQFDEIIDICANYDVRLNLTTNGTFPGRGAREWAKRIVPIGSDVKISWNGANKATQEKIMVGTRWDKVLANVRDFIEVRDIHADSGGNRCRVTFQLTFLESNASELADVVRLAADLGVDRIKGHHLWAHFEEIEALSMRRDSQSIRRWNRCVEAAKEAAEKYRLADGRKVLLENIFPLEEQLLEDIAPGGQCPFLGQEAWVSAEGRFDPCCAPDAQRRTLGAFGNLQEADLVSIWQGDAYKELAGSYRNRALCLGCNMRRPEGAQQ